MLSLVDEAIVVSKTVLESCSDSFVKYLSSDLVFIGSFTTRGTNKNSECPTLAYIQIV